MLIAPVLPGETGSEKLRTRPAVPAPSARRAMGGAARTTSATKVPGGSWGTSGVGDKAGANVWKLLIRTSHSFMPLLVNNPQYSDVGTRGKLSVSESKDP